MRTILQNKTNWLLQCYLQVCDVLTVWSDQLDGPGSWKCNLGLWSSDHVKETSNLFHYWCVTNTLMVGKKNRCRLHDILRSHLVGCCAISWFCVVGWWYVPSAPFLLFYYYFLSNPCSVFSQEALSGHGVVAEIIHKLGVVTKWTAIFRCSFADLHAYV